MNGENHTEVMERLAVIETKMDGVNTRLDIANGRTAKLEVKVEALTTIEMDTVNKVKGLTEAGDKRTTQLASWQELIRNNISTILVSILIAYLLYRFGIK